MYGYKKVGKYYRTIARRILLRHTLKVIAGSWKANMYCWRNFVCFYDRFLGHNDIIMPQFNTFRGIPDEVILLYVKENLYMIFIRLLVLQDS